MYILLRSRAVVFTKPTIPEAPIDPTDTQLSHYLIATWAKVRQALGSDFEPYPPLSTAGAKADLSVYGRFLSSLLLLFLAYTSAGEEESPEEKEGWEMIVMDGQTYGVKTSSMEEKCQAFETFVVYCSTLGPPLSVPSTRSNTSLPQILLA